MSRLNRKLSLHLANSKANSAQLTRPRGEQTDAHQVQSRADEENHQHRKGVGVQAQNNQRSRFRRIIWWLRTRFLAIDTGAGHGIVLWVGNGQETL